MKKKGFTLIELLAVIVILAIIALIAVPIVLNMIEKSKESATLRSAEYYLNAVEQGIARAKLNNIKVEDGTYNILSNGNICKEDNGEVCLTIEVQGEKPTGGKIIIEKGKIKEIELIYGDKIVIFDEAKGILIIKKITEEEKKLTEAKNIIASIETKIKEEQEKDQEVNPYECNIVDSEVTCYYKIEYEDCFEDECHTSYISKSLTFKLDIKKEVNSSLSIYNGKVAYPIELHINDDIFIKYERGDLFLVPELTDEYLLEQGNKFFEKLQKTLYDLKEQNIVSDNVSILNGGGFNYGEHSDYVNIDGLMPSSGSATVNTETSKIKSISFYIGEFEYGARRFLDLTENGSLQFRVVSIEYLLGIDVSEYPKTIKYGDTLTIDFTGKDIDEKYLYVERSDGIPINYTFKDNILTIPATSLSPAPMPIVIKGPQEVEVIYNFDSSSTLPTTAKQGESLTIDFTGTGVDVSNISIFYSTKENKISSESNYSINGNILTIEEVSGKLSVVNFKNPCVGVDYVTANKYCKDEQGLMCSIEFDPIASHREDYNTIKYKPGDGYICKVSNNTYYNFYVLSTNNAANEVITDDSTDKTVTSVNLIMNGNIYYDEETKTSKRADASNPSEVAWYNGDTNIYGPQTALTYLHNATKNWTNIPDIIMNYSDEGNGTVYDANGNSESAGYGKIETDPTTKITTVGNLSIEHLKARMIMKKEASSCNSGNSSNGYLCKDIGNGYWTLSSNTDLPRWELRYFAVLFDSNSWGYNSQQHLPAEFGATEPDNLSAVRPVITLPLNKIS